MFSPILDKIFSKTLTGTSAYAIRIRTEYCTYFLRRYIDRTTAFWLGSVLSYLHFLFLKEGWTMEKIKTEEVRRKRGRPKLDAHITEEYALSRRQALNKMYMYEGVRL